MFITSKDIEFSNLKDYNLGSWCIYKPKLSFDHGLTDRRPVTWRRNWPIRSITRIQYHQLTRYNSLWLWRWLVCTLSKRQSLTTTVLFRTTLTRTIIFHLFMINNYFIVRSLETWKRKPPETSWYFHEFTVTSKNTAAISFRAIDIVKSSIRVNWRWDKGQWRTTRRKLLVSPMISF